MYDVKTTFLFLSWTAMFLWVLGWYTKAIEVGLNALEISLNNQWQMYDYKVKICRPLNSVYTLTNCDTFLFFF